MSTHTAAPDPTTQGEDYDVEALAALRAERAERAGSRRGAAAFVWGDFVTEPGQFVEGAPGRWSPLLEGERGLRVDATAAVGIRIGGELVDGSATLFWRDEDGPTVAEFPGSAEGVIFSYDGAKFALQVWDPASEWASGYGGIAAFDADPSWRVIATVRPVDDGRTVSITHHRNPTPVDVPVVAALEFERDGVVHELLATRSGGTGERYVHFRDATSGDESYSAGRGLRIADDDTSVVLDFNRAELLPCSFSLAWNCPIPAAENTLPIAVRAGERHAITTDGKVLL